MPEAGFKAERILHLGSWNFQVNFSCKVIIETLKEQELKVPTDSKEAIFELICQLNLMTAWTLEAFNLRKSRKNIYFSSKLCG